MLAGANRIKLLRQLHDHPGQNIATLAEALNISRPYASQEMRRIQSRGLLKPTHRGSSLIFVPCADPQVSSAEPLLKAIRSSLHSLPPERDAEMAVIAGGLAHERRIAMVRSLLRSPKTASQLRAEVPMSPCSFRLHLSKLIAAGFATKQKSWLWLQIPTHPLGKAFVQLLQQDASK